MRQNTVRRCRFAFAAVALLAAVWPGVRAAAPIAAAAAPSSLSDQEFWRMIETFSEPGGEFRSAGAVRSDNVISNEAGFLRVIPALRTGTFRGAYLGVGPEQNFTFIVTLKPTIAFIIDVRRGNLLVHLLYKALIEMSNTRMEFLSRLFSRPSPPRLGADPDVEALFDAFRQVASSEELEATNLHAIVDRLERVHRFRLTEEDKSTLKDIYSRFRRDGPEIRWDTSGDKWIPSYAELMTKTDATGAARSYLASEASLRLLKKYQTDNRIVPLVGDFAGDKTIAAVGRYLKDHDEVVAVFYTSNVEGYLLQANRWRRFLDNVATLPTDNRSVFIRTFFRLIGYSGDRPQYATRTALDPIRESLPVSSVR